jgi:hypothetical protein
VSDRLAQGDGDVEIAILTSTASVWSFGTPRPVGSFKCYKATDLKDPKFDSQPVTLADGFGVNDGAFEVKKPFLLCNPEGMDSPHPNEHLLCHKIKGPVLGKEDRQRVTATDALGSVTLELIQPFLLCLPSAKTILP